MSDSHSGTVGVKESRLVTGLIRYMYQFRLILIRYLRFADDQTILARNQKGLQAMMDRLNTTSSEYGIKINIKKTKVLKISKGKGTIVRIHIGGKQIEQVKEFCYLGSMITADAKCHREIKRK